eukprot:scaffold116_cov235-Chaetoceros_neogracile.AAC.8
MQATRASKKVDGCKKCPDVNFALPIVSNQEDQEEQKRREGSGDGNTVNNITTYHNIIITTSSSLHGYRIQQQ